jgi:nitrogen fixation protein FixH
MSNEDNLSEKEESRKYGRKVLFLLLGFFAVFASVDAYFVYLAMKTKPGVVTENAYQRGLNYNEVLEEARRRKAEENGTTENTPTMPTTSETDIERGE